MSQAIRHHVEQLIWGGWQGLGGTAAWGGAGHCSAGGEELSCISLALYNLLPLLLFISYSVLLNGIYHSTQAFTFFSPPILSPIPLAGCV